MSLYRNLKSWCKELYRNKDCRPRFLLATDENHVLWLSNGQIRAVVTKNDPPENRFNGVNFALVQDNGNNQSEWFYRESDTWLPSTENEDTLLINLNSADVILDKYICKLVVESIKYDHECQLGISDLLERFVRGLRRQFSRPGLYIFELLQNAVDEGAKHLSFEFHDDNLIFQHDGKTFDAGDVFGLSAVGASGKSGRTIGFMGLGFKSVYNRFDRVEVYDGNWSFCYERPHDANSDSDEWKLLPKWCDDAVPMQDGFRCRFHFSRLRGEKNGLAKDFEELNNNDVVFILLARRSLKANNDIWTLRGCIKTNLLI